MIGGTYCSLCVDVYNIIIILNQVSFPSSSLFPVLWKHLKTEMLLVNIIVLYVILSVWLCIWCLWSITFVGWCAVSVFLQVFIGGISKSLSSKMVICNLIYLQFVMHSFPNQNLYLLDLLLPHFIYLNMTISFCFFSSFWRLLVPLDLWKHTTLRSMKIWMNHVLF